MSYGITDSGFVVKDFNVIKSEKITEARAVFGDNLDIRETNPMIVMFNIMATREQRMWNRLNDIYQNIFIVTANGAALDLLAVDRGLSRLDPTKSSGEIRISGDVATVVSNGDRFATSGDNSVIFESRETKQLGFTTEQFDTGVGTTQQLQTQAHGSYDPSSPWVTVVVDGSPYTETDSTSPDTGEFYVDYEDPTTVTFNSSISGLVSISYFDTTATNMTVSIKALLPGTEYNVGAGQITEVVSSISGIETVTNLDPTTGGTNEETDVSLRSRLIENPVSSWTEDDIRSTVENISGVRGAKIEDSELIDILDDSGESAENTWYKNTLTKNTLHVFRVTFYDDSAEQSYDLVEVSDAADVDAGEYKIDTSSGETDIIQYKGPNGAGDLQGDDTLTVTYSDNDIGNGVFRVLVIPTDPPLTSTLTTTIETEVKNNKPTGVSFFIDEPTFNYIAMDITIDTREGFTNSDVQTDVENDLTTFFSEIEIAEVMRHAKIIDILMDIEGILDVTSILYKSEDEDVNKGGEQGTDSALNTVTDNSNFTQATDEDNVIYTKDTDFQVTGGDIDWSISETAGNMIKRRYEASAYDDTLTVFGSAPDSDNMYYIGNDTETWNMAKIVSSIDITSSVSGQWEYYDGSSWQAFLNINDGTSDWNFGTDTVYVTFDKPGDWETTTVDGVSGYWIRYNVDTFTSSSGSTLDSIATHLEPAQGVVYTISYDIVTSGNITPLTNTILDIGTVTLV